MLLGIMKINDEMSFLWILSILNSSCSTNFYNIIMYNSLFSAGITENGINIYIKCFYKDYHLIDLYTKESISLLLCFFIFNSLYFNFITQKLINICDNCSTLDVHQYKGWCWIPENIKENISNTWRYFKKILFKIVRS